MQRKWEIWLDNQLSSALAKLIQNEFNITTKSAFILENSNLSDREIFNRARAEGYIILITKDADFPSLVTELGSPPKIIKLNTGNLPTKLLWNRYKVNFKSAIKILQSTSAEIIFIE
jgi:predicted nuclease of predicted toxin-antitoxin system